MPALALAPIYLLLMVLAIVGGITLSVQLVARNAYLQRIVEKRWMMRWGITILLSTITIPLMFVVVVVIGFGLLELLSFWATITSTPTDAFQAAISSTIPESVNILHFKHDIAEDQTIWLHFTITPEDLKTILSSERYEVSESQDCDGRLSWWKPKTLGDVQVYVHGGIRWRKTLCTNTTFDEVYCYAHERWMD